MKYSVTMSFYDNGDSRISKPIACDDDAVSSCVQAWNRDIYTDVFDSYDDAWEFYRNNKEA
jgi:hypothetical protein